MRFVKNLKMTSIEPTTLLLAVIVTSVFVFIITYIYFKLKLNYFDKQQNHFLEASSLLKEELKQEKELLKEEKKEKQGLLQQLSILKTDFKHLRKAYDDQLNDREGQLHQFESIARRVLHQQSNQASEEQHIKLKSILQPLQQRINQFELKVERSHTESVKRHQSLKEQIHFLSQRSQQIGEDANRLAKALKGDFKQQGNWGELILESILDKSGLVKGREYTIQQSERDDDGRLKKPDVVVHLPDGKKIVIDSKVSLNAYNQLINTDSKGECEEYQQAHLIAVRRHIDQLASKAYHDLYKMESPDFVLMFIPIDTAFSVIETNGKLYSYAYDKNIVIVTPSTLLATLKTIETLWRNAKQNRNAIEIADEAGKMYDKFVGFIDDMEKINKQLNTVQHSVQDSMKKLHSGQGNLVRRAEKIKSLGAKANKQLNGKHVFEAIGE
jgi:DNA recombination protein RmuC